MKKIFITIVTAMFFILSSLSVNAASDPYFASGEDLDFLMEAEGTLALEEIEYELRRFILYRKIERFLTDITYYYPVED